MPHPRPPRAARELRCVAAAALIIAAAARFATAAEGDQDAADVPAKTQPAAGMTPPDVAVQQIKAPPGFTVSLFAAEPRVRNPAAFHIDELGRFYVVEANRRRNQVLDIRKLPAWLDDDLDNRTVDDRIEMVTRRLSPNEVEKLRNGSDAIRRIEDTDGDGKADKDEVFATGFNQIEDGTAAGVLARVGPTGTDVWFTNIPNVWHFHETPDGKQDVRESLAYGFGVRYAFSGHDLHGLRFGPDGRLYFSIADRGLHVEKDGKVIVSNPDSGAVLRCEPDGSNLELYCTGLRNPQELAFDEHGNLFTADNNSDGGDATRWVYVVEGGDGGWRAAYQHHAYPVSRGPWNGDRLWSTKPTALPYSQLPPIANPKIAGPSGLTYAPGGPATSKQLSGSFMVVDFRGGPAGGSGIYSLRNTPKGAAFELTEETPFVTGVLPSDVDFGYDGSVYFTDWVDGWEPKGQGRIWRVTDPASADAAETAAVRQLVASGIWKQQEDKLVELLGHADQRVRQAAQFALAERGAPAVELLAPVAKSGTGLARLHAIWGIGQIARKRSAVAGAALVPLLADTDEEVRCQAAVAAGESRVPGAYDGLVQLLSDPSDRVKFFAATALGKIGRKDAAPAVLQVLRKNADLDGYLRHACVMALVGINDVESLRAAARDPSPAVRMGAVLAFRKLKSPEVASLLDDPEAAIVVEAARAINDVPIPEAYPDLAKLTTPPPPPDAAAAARPPARPELALVRAANAHYRLGGGHSAATLAAVAGRPGPESVRVLALNMLAEWAQPRVRDWICGLPIALPKRDAAPAREALAKELDDLLKVAPTDVRVAALEAASALGVTTAPLSQIVADADAPAGLRAAALAALAKRKDAGLAEAIDLALAQPDEPLRLAAVRAMPAVAGGTSRLGKVLAAGSPHEQQAALNALAAVKGPEADALLLAAFDRHKAGTLPPEAELDLLLAAEGRKGKVANALTLANFDASLPKAGEDATTLDSLAPYRATLFGGDAARGEQIFRDRADVSCMRCHAVNGTGGNAGPDLAGLAKRDPRGREFVLESIVFPSKHIAAGFESVIVRTKQGDVYAGVLKGEDAERVTIDVPNEGVKTIEKKQIDRRKGGMSAMPDDVAKPLTKSELRDLVEYLSGV